MCGDKTVEFLQTKGITTIYDLRQFSLRALQSWLGKHGTFLWNRAHGLDNSEVHPYHDPKSLSSERTFDVDQGDIAWLKKVMIALTETLAFDLRNEKKLSSCIAIKIRYDDFSTYTKQMAIPPTSNSKIFVEKAFHLFDDFYQHSRKVRLIGVRLSGLTEGNYQINMFDDREKDVLLYKAIDELKNKHGAGKIVLAQNLDIGNIKRHDPYSTMNKEVKREESKVKKKKQGE
jgi:DNA polymerase-4